MTAIAGIIDFGSGIGANRGCRDLLLAQREYGPHRSDSATDGIASLGRCLFERFAEDRHDRQPVRGAGGRTLLVADVRLDNRAELVDALGLALAEARSMADSAILMLCWERWGEAMLDRLAGPFALALWDGARRRLLLARDPFGQCPLHFARGEGWIAFASMPQALRQLRQVDGSPDLERLAAFVADAPAAGRATYFRGIERIEAGHALSVGGGGERYWRHWTRRPSQAAAGDLVEAFRFHLDQAVESCLRGSDGRVAAQLSGGWDSAAVTATAAAHLAPGRLLAITAAPPEGFDGAVSRGRMADEGAIAALVAGAHPNIDHRILRDRTRRPLALLADNDRLAGQPTGHVCNNLWWSGINALAAANGCAVVLTGEMGNHTLSAGGGMQLADLLRLGRVRQWLGEARALTRPGAMRWTGVLDQSFGGFVPFYGAVRPWLARSGRTEGASRLLAPWLRARVHAASPPVRPVDSLRHRIAMLGCQDSGTFRKAALARWGVDERDPTTERRFVEFCLSLPPEALLRDGVTRPVARAALADRLPQAFFQPRPRGLQFADWYRHVSPTEVADLAMDPRAVGLFDPQALEQRLAAWPASGFEQMAAVRTYRMDMLRAASAASFLRSFTDNAGSAPGEASTTRQDLGSIEGTWSIPDRG